jgi:cyanophycin synthetase
VVKPAEGFKGRAVSVGVTDEAGVLLAFGRAQAVSPEVIIESFIPGDEHRLLVVGGRFVAATRRRPAQVRGDGASTVRALVERENARPERDRRLAGRATSLVPLALDEEALALLSEQGLAPEAVPERGRAVLLRRQSNHAMGGDTVDATDVVDPTTRSMAERAAALLGIDVCGIDFITTDISRPYSETGAAICEINTRPGLKLHYGVAEGKARNVARNVLDMLFPDGAPSRCPVVVLVGTDAETAELRQSVERAAARAGRCLGVVPGPEGAEALAPTTQCLKEVGSIAWDKEVDAVLVQASAAEVVERGLGLDRIDLAILPTPGNDRTLAEARKALARLAGNRVLQPDDPAARKRVLAALGLPAPAKVGARSASAPVKAKERLTPAVPAAVKAGLPAVADVLRPRTASATVLMVGDIGFGEAYAHQPRAAGLLRQLDEHGYGYSVAKLKGLLSSADLVIGNLEVPLSPHPDSALRGRKKNLTWSDPDLTVEALRQAGVHAVSLANNHALDCGATGLDETLARLEAAGIASFGAGCDLASADQPFVRRLVVGGQERSVVVFGRFEHRAHYQSRYRWYARHGAPGVAELSAERIGASIAALRQSLPAPLFVAYPHWGDHYAEVSDAQREAAAQLIEAGVDLVIGHGSHTAQSVEMVAGRPVVFGLGNFVFNATGRYGKLGAQPYSLAAALVFQGGRGEGGTLLRLYPIMTDNTVTKFQNRLVTRDEFVDAVEVLGGGIKAQPKRGMVKAGPYLELRLDDWVTPPGVAKPASFGQVEEDTTAGAPAFSAL